MIEKTIRLTKQQDEWLQAEMASGRYESESEFIQALLRDRQRQQQDYVETPEEVIAIRAKIDAAERGGFTSLTQAQMLAKFKDDLGLHG